jgi:peptide deformylase
MIRAILIHPDPRLKKPCDPVAEVTSEITELARDMLETMYDAPGIGLADGSAESAGDLGLGRPVHL